MRTDSCRNCGYTLLVKKHCTVCTQPIQFQCEHCSKYAEDPFHLECEFKKSEISVA